MNDFKTLLVHLDATPVSRSRLKLVKQLATQQDARIEVLYAVMPWMMQYPLALDAGGMVAGQLMQWQLDARDAIRAAFEKECLEAGLAGLTWTETQGEPVLGCRGPAWAADLLVLSQHDPNAAVPSGVRADFVPSVLAETGKPGLVLPYIDVASSIGQNVLVAWKGTPESARALTAALPILQRAASVHVSTWDETDDAGTNTALPALQFLQRHGVTASLHHGSRPRQDLGDLLLSQASDLQADLLVMGCYGHGRAREWALGGVTRTVLQTMTLPVLMVH